jgi:hypothetical protein
MATPIIAAIITGVVAVGRELFKKETVKRVIAAVAIAAISRALTPKNKGVSGDRSARFTKRRDASPFKEAIFGTALTAGTFHDATAYGTDQMFYLEVIRLADHECDGLVAVYAGGKQLTINGDGSVQEYIEGSTPRMWIWFEPGSWGATAHSEMLTAFGGRYTSADRGRGICRAVIKCDMRSEKLFPSRSPPDLTFAIRGAKIYSPRLDGSLGGSQTWGNYASYAWSDNLADIAYNVARGLFQYGGTTPDFVVGGSYEADELPLAEWAAESTACNTPVALKAGGTEPRYRGGLILQANDQIEDALADLATGAGGFMLDRGGSLLFYAGIARTPVATLSDKDFIQGKNARTWRVRARERFNSVSGRFTDAALRYQQNSLPVRRSPSDITTDNGEERVESLDLGVVQSGTQGQRVMEIRRRLNRRAGMFSGQLPPSWMHLEAGDWITYTSAKRGWTKNFILMPLELQTAGEEMLASSITLVEINAADFAWNAATDELDVVNPVPLGPAIVPNGAILGFAATSGTLANGGEIVPVINVVWTVPTDPTVVEVAVEYQRLGDSAWARQSEAAFTGGAQITGLPGGAWRVRLVPITRPTRPVSATVVISVTLSGGVSVDTASVGGVLVATLLANIDAAINDEILTPAEKSITVIPRVESMTAGLVELTTQATSMGLSAASLQAALDSITNFFVLHATPVPWNDVSGNTSVSTATGAVRFGVEVIQFGVDEVWFTESSLTSLLTALSIEEANLRTLIATETARRAVYALVVDRPATLAEIDPVTANAINQLLPSTVISMEPQYPITSASSTTITIANAQAFLATGVTVQMSGAVLTGLAVGTIYAIFFDRETGLFVPVAASEGTSTYTSEPTRYISIGGQSTQTAGGGYVIPDAPPAGYIERNRLYMEP